MRIGVALPNYGSAAGGEELRRLAQHGEALGLASVWVSDHVIVPTQTASVYPYDRSSVPTAADVAPLACFYESLTSLAFLAGCTRTVRLGVSVFVLPLRNPIITAKTVASLDAISNGRAILGVGSGWLAEEFAALGVPFADREARTDEYLRVCKACWSEGDVILESPLYSAPPFRCEPKPRQRPHPPLWIGGNGVTAMRRAARLGDAWHPIDLSPAELHRKTRRLHDLCAEAGRDAGSVAVTMRATLRFHTHDDPAGLPLHGTPEKVRDTVSAYRASGLEHLVVGLRRGASVEELLREIDRIPGLVQ